MPGGMNLATKYAKQVDERWTESSQAALVLGNNNYSFKGDKTVVIYSIPIAPLNNYTRSGTSRYGTPDDLTRNIQTLAVSQDKGFTFIIDKGDEVQSEYVSNPGSALARQIREVIVPNFDRYCFSVMAQSAKDNGHYDTTAVTASNAYEMLLKGCAHMSDRNVPIENVICFCTYSFYGMLLRDPAFVKYADSSQKMVALGRVGRCAGVEVVACGVSKLPQGAAFLLVHKDSCVAPKQLEEYKIHDNPPGISGSLVEGRTLYDCFVLDEKAAGIYYHGGQGVLGLIEVMTAASAAGKTSVIVNKQKDASTNKWYYITASAKAGLPTATVGTPIDTTVSGDWYGAVELTAPSTEITPTSGHKWMAVIETDSSKYPLYLNNVKMNIG